MKNIIVKDPTERNAVLKSHYNMLGIRYVIRDNKCRCKTASCQGEVGYWGDVGFGFVLKTIIPHTCIHVCDDDADLNTGVDLNNDSGNDDTGNDDLSRKRNRKANAAYASSFIGSQVGDILKYNPKICAVDLQNIFAYVDPVFKTHQYQTIVRNGKKAYG